jgi:hypothetical protein
LSPAKPQESSSPSVALSWKAAPKRRYKEMETSNYAFRAWVSIHIGSPTFVIANYWRRDRDADRAIIHGLLRKSRMQRRSCRSNRLASQGSPAARIYRLAGEVFSPIASWESRTTNPRSRLLAAVRILISCDKYESDEAVSVTATAQMRHPASQSRRLCGESARPHREPELRDVIGASGAGFFRAHPRNFTLENSGARFRPSLSFSVA